MRGSHNSRTGDDFAGRYSITFPSLLPRFSGPTMVKTLLIACFCSGGENVCKFP